MPSAVRRRRRICCGVGFLGALTRLTVALGSPRCERRADQRRRLRAGRRGEARCRGRWATSPAAPGDELTLRENVEAWRRWRLRPRVLVGRRRVSDGDRGAGRAALDAGPGRAGRLPAAGRSRGRGRDGAGRRRGGHGDVPLDPGDDAAQRAGRRRRRGAALVPALLLPRRGGDPGADGRGDRVRLRGDRRHRRRAAGPATASATGAPASRSPRGSACPASPRRWASSGR